MVLVLGDFVCVFQFMLVKVIIEWLRKKKVVNGGPVRRRVN